MTDQEMKKLLTAYVDAEMSCIDMEEYSSYEIEPGKKFQKKMRRLFSVESYFGTRIKTGYMVRRAAIIILCMLSLLGANEVSARVLGFNPWKSIVRYLSESRMEQKIYEKKEKIDPSADKVSQAVRELPGYIPDGLVRKEYDVLKDFSVTASWWSKDGKKGISYQRIALAKNTRITSDAEYTTRVSCEVGRYQAYFYRKGEENWISWEDEEYHYLIQIMGYSQPEEELLKVADSIY